MRIIIIAFAFLTLLSCENKQNTTAEIISTDTANVLQLSDEQLTSFTLSTTALVEKVLSETLKLNGKITVPPQHLVSVSSALGGYVKSTKLRPGMHFKKGEVIAVLEDNQFIQLQQDYLTVKVQLQNSESEYRRQQDLNQSKASSDKTYLQAKTDYEILQISQRSLEEKLRLVHINPAQLTLANIQQTAAIYAPFDGFVAQVFVNVGKYVSPSDVLFELVNPRDLYLTIQVFEKDLHKIKVDQPVLAYTNSNTSEKHVGNVVVIGKNILTDGALEVHVRLTGNKTQLIPGRYMNAEIEVPNNMVWAVPEESVVAYEGKSYLFEVVGKNKFKMIVVQTGNSGNGWVEIVDSVPLKGKNIVERGAYTLLMALKNKGEEE